jgi:hypothetical protein
LYEVNGETVLMNWAEAIVMPVVFIVATTENVAETGNDEGKYEIH